jgi:tetratricopeptide (TPR) repeat protein
MRIFRRLLLSTLLLAGVLGVVGGALAMVGMARWGEAGWYYHYTPEYRLRCARQALRADDTDRAHKIGLVLEADGYKDHASLLRGEELFLQAKPYAETGKIEVAGPELNRAVSELVKIRDKSPLWPESALLIGKSYLYMHKLHDARLIFEYLVKQDENSVDAHRGLASIYYDQGARDRAILHLRKVGELDARDGRPYRLIALICKDQEQYDEAIKNYEEALQRKLPAHVPEQDPATVRQELAQCLVARAQFQRALEVLQEASPSVDAAADVEALRAEALLGMGRTTEAQQVLDNALNIFNNNGALCRLRARIHVEAKEFEPARKLLERALWIERTDYPARLQLIQVLKVLGDNEELDRQQHELNQVKKDMEERSRLEREAVARPWDASLRLRLAELCRRLNRGDLALMWERAAAACPPAPPDAPERKEEKRQQQEKRNKDGSVK